MGFSDVGYQTSNSDFLSAFSNNRHGVGGFEGREFVNGLAEKGEGAC